MAAHAVATEIKALLPQAQVNVDVGFRPGTELGIDVECVREWAVAVSYTHLTLPTKA